MGGTGGVRYWGYNGYGQLGTGNTTDLHSPRSSFDEGVTDCNTMVINEHTDELDRRCAVLEI